MFINQWQKNQRESVGIHRRYSYTTWFLFRFLPVIILSMVPLGVFLGFLSWYKSATPLSLMVISDGTSDNLSGFQTIVENNISSLEKSNLFQRVTRLTRSSQISKQMNDDTSNNLVLYVESQAWVSPEGKVLISCLPQSDSSSESVIDLQVILNHLNNSSKRKTVLVLNIFRNESDFLTGRFRDDLWSVSNEIIEANVGRNLAVIIPDDLGRPEIKIPGKTLGLFTHYFIEGLSGLAEQISKKPDGVIDTDDLFGYITIRMNEWTARYGYERSEPLLITESSQNFAFCYTQDFKIQSSHEILPRTYPEKLRLAWVEYENWKNSEKINETPILLTEFSDQLIAAEKAWFNGVPDEDIESVIDEFMKRLNASHERYHKTPSPPYFSVASYIKRERIVLVNDPKVNSLLDVLGKIKVLSNDPNVKPEKILELIDLESKKLGETTVTKKDNLLQIAYTIEAGSKHVWASKYELLFLVRCIDDFSRDLTIESGLLFQLFQMSESDSAFDMTVLHDLFLNIVMRERILSSPESWPDMMKLATPVFLKQHEQEMVLKHIRPIDTNTIKNETKIIQKQLRSFLNDQEIIEKSRRLMVQAMLDIYWIPRLMERFPELDQVVPVYINVISSLNMEIRRLKLTKPNELANQKNSSLEMTSSTDLKLISNKTLISQLNSKASNLHDEIWKNVGEQAVITKIDALNEMDSSHEVVNKLLEILEFPGCSALTRAKARTFLNSFWKSRADLNIDRSELIKQSELNKYEKSTNTSNSSLRRIKTFVIIASSVSPDWNLLNDLTKLSEELNTNHDPDLLIGKAGILFDQWINEYMAAAEYSTDYKITDVFTGLLYKLKYPIAHSSDHVTQKFQEFRTKEVSRFYTDMGTLLDYFSMDMGGSSILRYAAEEVRKITGVARKVSVQIIAVPQFIRYDTNHSDRVNCSIDVQVALTTIGQSKQPILNDFVQMSYPLVRANILSRFQNVSDFKIDSKSNELLNVQFDNRYDVQIFQNTNQKPQKSSHISDSKITLLMKTDVYGFDYHTAIPVYVNWLSHRPQLFFSFSDDQASHMKLIKIRPADSASPLFFNVLNPTQNVMDIILKMKLKNSQDSDSIEYSSKPVVIQPEGSAKAFLQLVQPPKPNLTPLPKPVQPELQSPQGNARSQWYGDATPVDRDLLIEVFDNRHPETGPLLQQTYRMQTATPTDLIEMRPLVYEPKNRRLSSELISRPEYSGTAPAKVQMRIPVFSFIQPDSPVLGVGGDLFGQLGFQDQKSLAIIASPVRIDPLKNGLNGRILFDIDHYERAFVFQNRWIVDEDRTLFPIPVVQPEIKILTDKIVRNGSVLRIKFEPINEPELSTILLESAEVSTLKGEKLNYREVHRFETSRQERFAVTPDEKTGSIKVVNGLQDWTYEMPTTGLIGRISLRAKLLDSTGKMVASHTIEILVDDQAVEQAHLIDIPEFVKIGTKLKIRIQLQAPASGLKQAVAILGLVKDRKVPDNAIQVRLAREATESSVLGKSATTRLETWSGSMDIPVKPELVGQSPLTIILETGAGLTNEVAGNIKIVAAEFVDTGIVKGSVMQASLMQSELPVVLRKMDAKRTEVARTKTDKQGQFQMPAIAPGTYGIFTAKSLDQTSAQAEVIVKSGQITSVSLSLGRVNLPSNGPAPKAEQVPPVK